MGNGAVDEVVLTRPIGQELELVPLKNPNEVKAGGILPVKVLYKGEPWLKPPLPPARHFGGNGLGINP